MTSETSAGSDRDKIVDKARQRKIDEASGQLISGVLSDQHLEAGYILKEDDEAILLYRWNNNSQAYRFYTRLLKRLGPRDQLIKRILGDIREHF